MARPKITIKNLPKAWRKNVEDEMKQGASLTEIDALLRIAKTTRLRLIKEDELFSNTIKRGIANSKAWWLKKGRINLENKEFSAVLWYMNMKNRFGWRDSRNLDITSGGKPIPLMNVVSKNKK